MGPAVAQGRFLVEAAAVQRAAAVGQVLSLIRFREDGLVSVTGTGGSTEFSVDADRFAIAAGVLPPTSPAPGDAEDFPATEPPLAVHAEILRDLGVHADALDGYLGASLNYVEVHTDGTTRTTVRISDGATTAATDLPLDEPPIGLPYTLVEQFPRGMES